MEWPKHLCVTFGVNLDRYVNRRIHEPEVIESEDESDDDSDVDVRRMRGAESSEEEEEEELSDTEIERRRQMLKQRALQAKEQQVSKDQIPKSKELWGVI